MKKLPILLLIALSTAVRAQQTIRTTRTTHLLKTQNQATFDHSVVALANEELFVFEYYPSEYYRVRYKLADYYVYYPYFRDVVGIGPLTADLRNKSIAPREKGTYTAPAQYTPERTIHTGPRGGRYYINKNGNKTYIKQ